MTRKRYISALLRSGALAPARKMIAEELEGSGANVSEAARNLGIGRATLYRWMGKVGISRERGEFTGPPSDEAPLADPEG